MKAVLFSIMLFGPPGSGKGTQTQQLVEEYNIPRIVTGDILRAKAKEDPELQALLQSGELVPDDMVCEIVKERLQEKDCENGYIFDGFPRTLAQAEYLSSIGVKPNLMVVLNVEDEVILQRLGGRRIHEGSGRVYNIHTNPPKVKGRDDITGEPLITRKDDQESSIRNRLNVYRQQTEPVIEYYEDKINVAKLDGNQDPKVLFEEIKSLVDKNLGN